MKEFTTEQKAQRYDKAIERANKIHKYSSDLAEIKRMEDIFPEFIKEIEDEEESLSEHDPEYIRKDAFIEKTCEFIKERFSFEDSWHVEGETSILDKVIEDFKKYMEE